LNRKNGKIYVDAFLCKGCSLCIDFCPKEALKPSTTMNKKGVFPPVVDDEKCILCGTCTLFCPDFAIFIAEDSTLESRGA